MEAVGKPRRRRAGRTGHVAVIENHPPTPSVAIATEAPSGTEELSEDQNATYEVTMVVPDLPEPALDRQLAEFHRPNLIPEWVPKLQWIASGAALFFAAVAIVVERHEVRYHRHELPPEEI